MTATEFYKKTTNYWQAVLRVGLPIITLYRASHYLAFFITMGTVTLHYPWRFAVIMDVITIFVLSTLWWSLMRSGFGKQRGGDTTSEGQRGNREH